MLQKRRVLIWALGVSIGCANFLEDVKVHLVHGPSKIKLGRQAKIEKS
jgi:hypothetical protein